MPSWTKEQEEAIYKDGSNIIVSAGAGSGKTAVLSERVLNKISKGVHINELLILTFTRAAADEMKERIRKKISKDPKYKDELDKIDSAYITTFDSFSLSILKKYHYLLNLPKEIDITDESIISISKKNILDNIFERLYETDNTKFTEFIDKYTVKNDSEIRKLILSISRKVESFTDRDEYLNYIENEFYSDSNINTLIEEYVVLINNLKEEVKLELENLNYYFDSEYVTKVESVILPLLNADLETLHNYTKITIPKVPNGTSDEGKNAKSKLKNTVDNLLKHNTFGNYENMKKDILSTKSDVSTITQILRMFFLEYDDYSKKRNIYNFSDIANLAIKLVRDNKDVRLELKNTFKEIMIDEYQDTNDIQEYFISMISNNNVYMVGDVKQSIYKFRGSNPSIFKEKYINYSNNLDGYKIDLIKNFRSREEVLNNINMIFNLIMDSNLGGAEYHDTHQMIFGNSLYNDEKEDYNYNLEVLEYNDEEVENYTKQEIEIFAIATDIKNKINNNVMVFDKETNKLREATYSDFVIIVDRSKYFDMYKKIFEYMNIPLTILKDGSLNASDDIYIIKNIIDIIIRIHNFDFGKEFKYDFLSIGRSFLYEYSDDYLLDVIMNNKYRETNLYNDFSNIDDFNSITPSIMLDRILEITDFYNKIYKIGDLENIDVRLSNISDMASKLANIDMSIVDFRDYLSKIIDDNIDIKYTSFSKSSNSVKIMTIHKSKGLEYPICYFSDLDHDFNTMDLNSKFICDKKYGIIVPTDEDNGVIKTIYKDNYIREEISEKIRLFYVALTRAREKIIIVLPEKDTDKLEKNANGVIEYIRRTKFKKLSDMIYAIKNYYPSFFRKISLNDINLSKNYLYNNNKKAVVNDIKSDDFTVEEIRITKKVIDKKHFSKSLNQLADKKTKENMLYGEYVHGILEYINFKDFNPNSIDDSFIRDKICKLLENDLFKNVKAAKIYREYEFSYVKDNISYNGIIDLMLEYDDHIDIVDYKLSNIKDDKYKDQLNGYKKYISDKTDLPIYLYLYSIINETLERI